MSYKQQSATSPARAAAALIKTIGDVLSFVGKTLPAWSGLVNGIVGASGWLVVAALLAGGAR